MEHLQGIFTFPAEEPALADHFPDSPIIPGTLIINAFVSVLREHLGAATPLSAHKFRFKSFITPARYAFTMKRTEYGYACTLFKDDKAAVTGRLHIENLS